MLSLRLPFPFPYLVADRLLLWQTLTGEDVTAETLRREVSRARNRRKMNHTVRERRANLSRAVHSRPGRRLAVSDVLSVLVDASIVGQPIAAEVSTRQAVAERNAPRAVNRSFLRNSSGRLPDFSVGETRFDWPIARPFVTVTDVDSVAGVTAGGSAARVGES